MRRRDFMKLTSGAVLLGGATSLPLFAANNGTVVGSPTFAAAKFGNGITSSSDSNYISIPTGLASTISGGNFTLEAWMQAGGSGLRVGISIGAAWIGIDGSDLCTYDFTSMGFSTGGGGSSLASGIHHVALVISGGNTLNVYIDGVLAAGPQTGTFAAPGAVTTFIGRYQPSSGFSFQTGKIDEVVVWNTAQYTAGFAPATVAYGSGISAISGYHLDSDGSDFKGGGGGGSTAPVSRIGGNISGGDFAY